MDLSALTLDTGSVLAMGLMIVSAYASIWAVKKVIHLAMDSDYPQMSRKEMAQENYKIRESLYQEGWTDDEYRMGTRYIGPK